MDDALRVTVIATGFDKLKTEERGHVRRTVPLEADGPLFQYKGEDNLKTLDTPAFERRSMVNQERLARLHASEDEQADPKNGKIKRLNVDDLRERPERIRKENTDTPAFLRKMMD